MNAAIGISTAYLVVYVILAQLPFDWSTRLTLFLFSVSPLPVLWLVWRVLRDNYTYPGTFEERFYRDAEFIRLPATGEGTSEGR